MIEFEEPPFDLPRLEDWPPADLSTPRNTAVLIIALVLGALVAGVGATLILS